MTDRGREDARGPRADDALRRPKRWMAAFLLLAGAACAGVQALSLARGASPALIVSDGKQYYSWARSIVLDGDLDFRNDYELLYPPDPLPDETGQRTPRGLVVNKYPVGMALLETPGLLLGHAAARLLPGLRPDGASTPYQVAVSASLIAFSLAGAYALFLAALRLGADPFVAGALTAAVLAATNLWHYVAREPAMPHAAGMALGGVALFVLSGWKGPWEGIPHRQLLALGACLGLLVLVRNSNVALAPAFAALAFRGRPFALRPALLVAAPAAAIAALQPIAFSLLWGGLRLTPYPDEAFAGGWGGIVRSLASSRHGLLVYHPLYALLLAACAAGLLRPATRTLAAGALSSFGLLVVVNGTWWCWWFGDSFGNRAFIEALPPLVLASAVALSPLAARRPVAALLAAVLVAVTLANAVLWTGYVLKRFPQDGRHSVRAAWLWFLPSAPRGTSR